MKNLICILIILCSLLYSSRLIAQQDTIPIVPQIKLSGPRFGITLLTGEIAETLEEDFDVKPIITQFGWQFETRFFTLPNGTSGLVEAVGLIGGLEQGKFLPSASFLVGFRNIEGVEFGFGPNLSLTGAAFVISGGVTIKRDYVNFPVNFAVVPSNKGIRVSLLVGVNVRGQVSILPDVF